MQSINAISLTHSVNDWLKSSRNSRILHIFDKACNLINERGEVLSIVTSQIGEGPFNLVVEDDVRFFDHCNLESPISFSPTQMTVGNLVIYMADAILWSPRPNWDVLHSNREKIANCVAELKITNYFNMPIEEYSGILNHQNMPITQSVVSNFSLALVKADLSSAGNVASQLAGLGIGLTPSADDFIMGAIYAVWIIHPLEIASVLAQVIANTAAPLTTSLSAAWLKSAAKGDAGIIWHDFFDGLVFNNILQIQKTMKNILAVGETSGADALAGFASVFESWMEKVNSSHE